MNRPARIAVACAVTFTGLSIASWLRAPWLTNIDVALHTAAVTLRNEPSITVARAVTEAGSTYIAIPLIALLGVVATRGEPPRRRLATIAIVTVAAGAGAALGLAINAAINGVRPGQAEWVGAAGGPTYPSGHTTVATLLASGLVWAFAERRGSRAAWVVAVVLAVGVGVSRVWLGVHWPSDVVGGWLFGTAWAAAMYTAFSGGPQRESASRASLRSAPALLASPHRYHAIPGSPDGPGTPSGPRR